MIENATIILIIAEAFDQEARPAELLLLLPNESGSRLPSTMLLA